jgi:hypothetical protein
VSLYWAFAATFLVSALALAAMVPAVGRVRVVRELG